MLKMVNRCLALVVVALLPSQLEAGQEPRPQLDAPKTLRLVVESDPPKSTLRMIESLRKLGSEYGFDLTFINDTSAKYDVLLVVSVGSGSRQAPGSKDMTPVSFTFCTAAALDPGGKLIFTKTDWAVTDSSAVSQVGKQVMKELYKRYGSLKQVNKAPATTESNFAASAARSDEH